jgi:hypothetical protein
MPHLRGRERTTLRSIGCSGCATGGVSSRSPLAAPEPRIPETLEEIAPERLCFRDYRYVPGGGLELELLPVRLAVDPGWQFVSYSSLSPQCGHDSPFDYDAGPAEDSVPDAESPEDESSPSAAARRRATPGTGFSSWPTSTPTRRR